MGKEQKDSILTSIIEQAYLAKSMQDIKTLVHAKLDQVPINFGSKTKIYSNIDRIINQYAENEKAGKLQLQKYLTNSMFYFMNMR